jgi:hypothetical protein
MTYDMMRTARDSFDMDVMLTFTASALNITNMYKSSLGYMKVRYYTMRDERRLILIASLRCWICRLSVSLLVLDL